MAITDDEVSALNLSITPASISENGGTATVTVSRNTEELGELTVDLFSDDTSEATVPATVTIPAGQVSATFTLTAVDDMKADGTKVVTVTASVEGFTDGVEMLDVLDDEFPTLTLSITPASISENGGTRPSRSPATPRNSKNSPSTSPATTHRKRPFRPQSPSPPGKFPPPSP